MATDDPSANLADSQDARPSAWPLKYARVERELRYLLRSLPTGLAVRRRMEIHDCYVKETGLRLRAMREDGKESVRKLGQKVPLAGSTPPSVAHTTIYLTDAEYATLRSLAVLELRKTRHIVELDGAALAIDVFHGHLAGLVLAEIDLGDEGEAPAALGVEPVAEVTADARFTGGALAATSPSELRALLAPYGIES